MILFKILATTLVLFQVLQSIDTSRILGLFTAPSKSHLLIHMAIVESLVERGHNVTVITTNSVENKNNSFRHIQVDTLKQMPPEVIRSMSLAGPLGNLKMLQMLSGALMPVHNSSLHHPKVRDIMDNESFDLVTLGYFFNDFQLGVAAHFKCPVVVSFMVRPIRFVSNLVGQPLNLLYVPKLLTELHQPMNFFDRIKNIGYQLYDLYLGYETNKQMQEYYEYNFPPDKYPTLDEMRRNVSIVLTNYHFSEGPISPTVPALIEVGGIQIKEKPDPLPKDVKTFLDEAQEGAIFFSFGSNYVTTKLKPDIVDAMQKVFAKLKQRVLMKWEGPDFVDKPSNVLYKQWLPQDDILAHPNLKLFITHGGKGSIAETQYHAVPIVGIPLFGDQVQNVNDAIRAGFGVRLNLDDITEETLSAAIKEVLENPKYRNNIKTYSKIYRDRPMTARASAAYWIQYVIRHNGAKHLQSPAVDMNFIQYYGLDILAAFMVISYLVLKIVLLCIAKILRYFRRKISVKTKDE